MRNRNKQTFPIAQVQKKSFSKKLILFREKLYKKTEREEKITQIKNLRNIQKLEDKKASLEALSKSKEEKNNCQILGYNG